jgi:hypothetical protein
VLHVDMFAHNKSGIAYRDRNRSQRPLSITKRNPTSSRGCYQVVPVIIGMLGHPGGVSTSACATPAPGLQLLGQVWGKLQLHNAACIDDNSSSAQRGTRWSVTT